MNTNEKTKFNIAFGKYVKDTRVSKGILQLDICNYVGLSQSYYSQIESGVRNVDLQVAFKICKYLNLDLGEFMRNYK